MLLNELNCCTAAAVAALVVVNEQSIIYFIDKQVIKYNNLRG